MTLVTGTVQDLGYDGMEGTLWVRPARFRSDGQVVYAPERKPFTITGGVVSAELAPGPAVLELQVGSHARGTFEVVIPDTDIGLADLLDAVFPWEPAQVSLFVAEREAAEQAKADAEQAAGTATDAAQQTGQDRSHVDQVRTLLDEAYDESQAGMALPPRLTETALNATYVPQSVLPTLATKGEAGRVDTDAYAPLRARLQLLGTTVVPIVFFGSSSTQGTNVEISQRWINVLASMFTTTPVAGHSWTTANTDVNNAPPGLIFINLGRSGSETFNYIDTAYIPTHLATWNPALIFHMVGANDIVRGGTAAGSAANVAAMIDAIDAACPLPVGHVYIHQHERYDDRTKSYTWAEHLAALRGMAESRPNVSVLDLSGQFRAVGIPDSDPFAFMEDDEAHVNAAGNRFYADAMAVALTAALPTVNVSPPPTPEVLVADNFNRPDSDLHSSLAQTGQAWEVATGAINVTGGKMVPATGSGFAALIDAGAPDVDITVECDYNAAGSAGLVFRALDVATNRWGIYFAHATEMRLYRFVDGVNSIAASKTKAALPAMPDLAGIHTLRVRAKGANVTIWVDGVECLTYAMTPEDAAASAEWTKVGTRTSSAAATWDDLVVKEAL